MVRKMKSPLFLRLIAVITLVVTSFCDFHADHICCLVSCCMTNEAQESCAEEEVFDACSLEYCGQECEEPYTRINAVLQQNIAKFFPSSRVAFLTLFSPYVTRQDAHLLKLYRSIDRQRCDHETSLSLLRSVCLLI